MILDQKHARFQKLCRQFAETEFTKELLDKLEETGDFDWDIFKKMAKYGFCGVKIPKEYGGAGGDHISYAITVEELSKKCASTGVICSAHTSLCCWPIFNWGTEEQKRKFRNNHTSGSPDSQQGPTAAHHLQGSDLPSHATQRASLVHAVFVQTCKGRQQSFYRKSSPEGVIRDELRRTQNSGHKGRHW